jgi:hypothetical protein
MIRDITTIRQFRLVGDYEKVIADGELLSKMTPKDPEIYEELCIAYFHTKQFILSYKCLDMIMLLRPVDTDILNRTVENKILFESMYVTEKWIPPHISNNNHDQPFVTVTITSCKRLPLFLQSMESFMRCVDDKSLFTEFLCIDDNSSEEDRQKMKQEFPFIKYIMKDEQSKGHVKSMQMIAQLVTTPYIFHMEDDWLFHNRVSVSDMLEIMLDQPTTLRQVCVNKNYDVNSDRRSKGGLEHFTRGNLRYFIHEYCDPDMFYKKYGNGLMTCCYWPHFSLQPSLIDTRIFSDIEFEDTLNFEMAFAHKYAEKGWKSAFLQESNTTHIGKNTWEHDRKNAYELNDVRQY